MRSPKNIRHANDRPIDGNNPVQLTGGGGHASSGPDESDFDGFSFFLDGACDQGGGEARSPVYVLGGKEGGGGAFDIGLAFDSPEDSSFSIPEGRGRSKEGRKNRVTLDDFDDPSERYAADQIIESVKAMFKGCRGINEQAITWLFGHAENNDGATFKLCCQALDAREFLIQARVQYEFWVRWKVFPFEFPFETSPLPNIIRHEIRHVAGEEGIFIAQEAWIRPGITRDEMLMNAAGVRTIEEIPDNYPQLLAAMEEKYILSARADSWYLTGRNPQRRIVEASGQGLFLSAHSVSWSRLY